MKKITAYQIIIIAHMCINTFAIAQENNSNKEINELYENSLTDLLAIKTSTKANIGTRGEAVDLLKAKVPVGVITAEQINRTGYTELSKVLQRFIPGFNFPRPSTRDGTDHIRPFTLRGMSPDQVLVLVNGKRLHTSTLLHVNGTIGRGSTGVDLNTIPLRAIARVEVLRDAAAAQYGSDAIAGIINIILKSGGEEHRLTSTIGQTYDGDGELYQTDLHYGLALPLDGFIDLTAEFRSRNPSNRSVLDNRQQYFDGDPRNNRPSHHNNQRGDPDTQDLLFALNAELPLTNTTILYSHGSVNYRESESAAFFRRPLDDRNVRAIHPNGFLPLIKPDILDFTTTVGAKGETDLNFQWDLSHTVGMNTIDYQIKNSVNASLGTKSPTNFDAGGLSFRQHTSNFDLFKELDLGFDQAIKVAAGLEWRYETFEISAGDRASYIDGTTAIIDGPNAGLDTITGSQGFPGFNKDNELQEDRHNFSSYIDLGGQFNDQWSVGLAGRYEYYNDFGSSLNGKFSLAFQVIDELLVRGSISTGFRAPSLQQSFFNSTSSINLGIDQDDNIQFISTLSVDSPIAKVLGAQSLEAEESQHFTAGIVFKPASKLSFSGDYFYTKIDNRIIFSRNITSSTSPEVADILAANDLFAARFFTNAIDTETQGFDLRANYTLDFHQYGELILSSLYHYNRTKILGSVRSPSILGANGGNFIFSAEDRERLESGQPNESLILMADYNHGPFNGVFKFIKAGAFSEQGRRRSSQWLADIDIAYQMNKYFNLAGGAHNLFNSSPDRNSGEDFLQESPYGYNGGFYYLRLSAEF